MNLGNYLRQRKENKRQKYIGDLKRRRLVLVWAAQRVDEEIDRLEPEAKLETRSGEESRRRSEAMDKPEVES